MYLSLTSSVLFVWLVASLVLNNSFDKFTRNLILFVWVINVMRTVVIFMTIDIKFLLQIEIFFLCILRKREFSYENMTISTRIYHIMVENECIF